MSQKTTSLQNPLNNSSSKQRLTRAEIKSIPKVELHRHLDCSMRWSTLYSLAKELGISIGQNPRQTFLITEPMRDLDSVLRKFLVSQKVLSSAEILSRLAFEACEDAFNDGVLILELRYAPTFIAEGHPHLSFEKIHEAFCRGITLAQKKWPIAVGLIGIVQRIKSVHEAENVIDFMIANKDSFIGVDLADNEENFDPKIFAPIFQKAKKSGLRITIHSGEAPVATSPQWVKDSIDVLGAERIGHGIQIINDVNILNYVREKKIPLEVCPWSNHLTQAFPNLESHPLRKLINSGIFVTLNSDDPGIFDSTLSDDYDIAQNYHGFTLSEFNQCNQIAYEASFISEKEKARVWIK